jgi:hypothetical protein
VHVLEVTRNEDCYQQAGIRRTCYLLKKYSEINSILDHYLDGAIEVE